MATFDVDLVVEGIALTDDDLDRIFDVLPDAVPASIGGVTTIGSPVEARYAEDAVWALVEAVGELFPEADVVRVDQDLVAIIDIAERTDRTRESVRLLVEGRRGPGGFPTAVGTVGGGIRVWPWSVVVDWFAEAMGIEVGDPGVPPEVAAVVDACLANRRRHLTHRAKVTWDAPAPIRLTTASGPGPRYAVTSAPDSLTPAGEALTA